MKNIEIFEQLNPLHEQEIRHMMQAFCKRMPIQVDFFEWLLRGPCEYCICFRNKYKLNIAVVGIVVARERVYLFIKRKFKVDLVVTQLYGDRNNRK